MAQVGSSGKGNPRRSGEFSALKDVEKKLDCKASKLHQIFLEGFHMPPGEFLQNARISFAQRQLEQGEPVTSVAFESGYDSVSGFNEAFKAAVLMTPSEYRDLKDAKSFRLGFPSPFNKRCFLGHMRRNPESPTLLGNQHEFRIGTRHGFFTLKVSHVGFEVEIGKGDAFEIHRVVQRLIGKWSNPAGFETSLKDKLASQFSPQSGLRVYGTPDLWEALVWSIVGQQVNLSFASTLRGRLATEFGTEWEGLYSIPGPETVAELQVEKLLALQYSRQKAAYLIELSKWAMSDEFRQLSSLPAPLLLPTLMAQKGIGVWSANYLCMRGLGLRDCVPLGDTGLTSGLRKVFGWDTKPTPELISTTMEQFLPHRSLATAHLWQVA